MKKETFYRKMDDIRRAATRTVADVTNTSYKIKAEDDVPEDFKGDIKNGKAYPTLPSTIKSGIGGIKKMIKSRSSQKQSTSDFKALRAEREAEGMPDENPDGTLTEGYKARSVAANVRARLLKGQK